ncbi:MAG: transposase [Methylocystis sp.]
MRAGTIFAASKLLESTDDGKPHQIILRRLKTFSKHALEQLASTALTPGAEVVSEGLACFSAVVEAGCSHKAIVTGSGPEVAKRLAFKWVNMALGNIKAALVGTYRAVREKEVARSLADFQYRLTADTTFGEMIRGLASVALATPPMPYTLLKLADVQARSGQKIRCWPFCGLMIFHTDKYPLSIRLFCGM